MLVFIAFAQNPTFNGHAAVSSEVRGVSFGPTPLLYRGSYTGAHVLLNY